MKCKFCHKETGKTRLCKECKDKKLRKFTEEEREKKHFTVRQEIEQEEMQEMENGLK